MVVKWLKKNLKNIITFAGPVLFELSNQMTGDWVNAQGRLSIGIGKFVTILIGVSYFGLLSYFTYKDSKKTDDIDRLNIQIEKLKSKCNAYKENAKSLCDIFAYTTEKIKHQIQEFRKKREIDTYFLNITNAATLACERVYRNIMSLSGETAEVTVNYYRRFEEQGKIYSEMIAHEGYNSNPKFFKIKKLLKIDKNSYYCEKLLNDDNPDVVFLPDKDAVKRALKIKGTECKYNQYVGIPIRRLGSGEKVALIEIVAHNDSVIWNDKEEVRDFINRYCEPFKEYVLMIDMLSKFYETVNEYEIVQKRGNDYAEHSEVSNEGN